jgi:hypothetical protein
MPEPAISLKGTTMNTYITLATAAVIRGICLGLVKLMFWSAFVIFLTLLALPGLAIWLMSAYILSISDTTLETIRRMTRHITPKFPRKTTMGKAH